MLEAPGSQDLKPHICSIFRSYRGSWADSEFPRTTDTRTPEPMAFPDARTIHGCCGTPQIPGTSVRPMTAGDFRFVLDSHITRRTSPATRFKTVPVVRTQLQVV